MHPTVVFASGKGGVGKSTVALNVAVALARDGARVGLVDADVYGPDIPAMFGITRRVEARSLALWGANLPKLDPVEVLGVKVISPQFLIGEDQALDWQAPLIEALLRRLVEQTEWGELDLLLVDLPPGTGDLQQGLFGLLADPKAVLVVTPQYVSHLDGRKLLTMLRKRGIQVVGAVENMAELACPHCGGHVELFDPTATERTVWSYGVDRLGSLPFVPAPGIGPGVPLVVAQQDTPTGRALEETARAIRAAVLV
ncbi:MAG TPA: P-loop NTPase [Actinopolymorphaceae bacterium]